MFQPNFLPYAKQSITSEDIEAVVNILKADVITRGPTVETFEQAIAAFCDAKFGVAFSSGSAALYAACHAVKVGPFDRLITTPNTFIATSGAGMQYCATPIFIDIDRNTGNLDLEQLSYNLDYPSTRGKNVVVPVHFSGIPVDMEKIAQMIKETNTVVIEDAAHALGSRYSNGKKVGCCENSDMTIFSFHPAKHITTGEGGMVTTNDEELCHRLKRYRNNGIEKCSPYLKQQEAAIGYYEVQEITGNFNFTDIQAALGLSQLKRLDQMVARRRELVQGYRERLQGMVGIHLFTDAYDAITAFHLFVAQIDFSRFGVSRTETMAKLAENGIGTQVHYIPLYRHPIISNKSGDLSEFFPQMEAYYAEALSLPLYYGLSLTDVDRVVETLKKVIRYPYISL
ncbi:MAG TPA: UDP-4-amino-4,6-dideoxy-N-acetyl-beta-L-altrosamine transaminase [Waddliaceae bacterium]